VSTLAAAILQLLPEQALDVVAGCQLMQAVLTLVKAADIHQLEYDNRVSI